MNFRQNETHAIVGLLAEVIFTTRNMRYQAWFIYQPGCPSINYFSFGSTKLWKVYHRFQLSTGYFNSLIVYIVKGDAHQVIKHKSTTINCLGIYNPRSVFEGILLNLNADGNPGSLNEALSTSTCKSGASFIRQLRSAFDKNKLKSLCLVSWFRLVRVIVNFMPYDIGIPECW